MLSVATSDAAANSARRPAADFLTVLRCDPGRRATKLVSAGKDGVEVSGYDAGSWFAVETVPVDGIAALAGALDAATADRRAFLIRGEPLAETDLSRCRRLLHEQPDGTPPTFREVPRRYAVLDFDAAPWPPGGRESLWDWRDGALSGAYLRSLLPAEFHGVSFWWSFSSGAGFKPGLRMKLAFWLDRPVAGDELGRWLADAPVDHAVFRPVQAVFVARPILCRVADPVPGRSGLEWDAGDAVAVPELPAEEPAQERPPEEREAWRERPAAAYGWPYGVLQEVAESIATTPPAGRNRWNGGGRHHALYCGALRVSGLIEEGLLDPRPTVNTLAAAARQAGIADREAARTIRNAFRRGGLSA